MYSPNLVGLDIKNYLYNKEETRLKAGLPTSSIFARLVLRQRRSLLASPRDPAFSRRTARPRPYNGVVNDGTQHNNFNSPHTCRMHPNKKESDG